MLPQICFTPSVKQDCLCCLASRVPCQREDLGKDVAAAEDLTVLPMPTATTP